MCGRFTLRTPAGIQLGQFTLDFPDSWQPRYNIAPTQAVPIITDSDGTVQLLRWGLVPSWSKDKRAAARMINARSETVSTKPAFRSAFRRRRALVPADGYFEWVKQGQQKQPYWMRMPDDQPFALAGLWETWQPKDDPPDQATDAETPAPPYLTFTILTTEANAQTAELHDRMPVILSPSDYALWLDTEQGVEQLQHLFAPSQQPLQIDPVSTRVNSARNDDKACVEIVRTLF